MSSDKLQLTINSLKTELSKFKEKPYLCLFEYIWNSFDAGATEVDINYKFALDNDSNINEILIEDNGSGWDFKKEKSTKLFLSSAKQDAIKEPKQSLPKGKYGRARYVFVWIADHLEIFSSGQKLTLNKDTEVKPEKSETAPDRGTKVVICKPNYDFSSIFFDEKELFRNIALEFCWFLKQNDKYKIRINKKLVDIKFNIKKEFSFGKEIFEKEDIKFDSEFSVSIVIWEKKPSEWSKFFFLDNEGKEISVILTGMNKKGDDFWHSVYIRSDYFKNSVFEDNSLDVKQLSFGDGTKKENKKIIIVLLKQKLEKIRREYLVENSESIISNLEKNRLLPNLPEMGIYDKESFKDLLKAAYTISPSLFVRKSEEEQKFICTTFAGLLSSQDDDIVKTVLEQLQALTPEDKAALRDILKKTSLSNVVKTIKEVESRLAVIDKLKKLVFDSEKHTLESELQRVLDENFWIFGEQFRLFSTTEGSLKKVLYKYAEKIFGIENPEISANSRKEVDLFLVKTQSENEKCKRNVVVEIKRPNKTLGKEEYDQIEEYKEIIINESVCNSENMYWEFYLIGNEYNEYIKKKINAFKLYGELERGLVFWEQEGRVKLYVRKWSDILEVEWENKMKFLKEKLKSRQKI